MRGGQALLRFRRCADHQAAWIHGALTAAVVALAVEALPHQPANLQARLCFLLCQVALRLAAWLNCSWHKCEQSVVSRSDDVAGWPMHLRLAGRSWGALPDTALQHTCPAVRENHSIHAIMLRTFLHAQPAVSTISGLCDMPCTHQAASHNGVSSR